MGLKHSPPEQMHGATLLLYLDFSEPNSSMENY